MAMTKKERAEFDAALLEARTLGALRWTAPVLRDVPPPKGNGYTEGWDYNVPSQRVWLGWSTAIAHGTGAAPKGGRRHASGSQNCKPMYSSRALALAALRHEIEREAARNLLRIDNAIADESKTEGAQQ